MTLKIWEKKEGVKESGREFLVIGEIRLEARTVAVGSARHASIVGGATSESETVGPVFCLAGSLAFNDAVALEN